MNELKAGKDFIGVGCGVFLINDNEEVLLLKRSKNSKNEKGYWNKVGGEVEFGEKLEDALRRETKEELNIEIDDIEFLSVTDHILSEEKQHWVGFNYMAKIMSGTPKIMEPDKCDEMKWFRFDRMPDKLAMPTKESLPLMIKKYKEKYR